MPADQRTPAQEASFALSVALVDEIKNADTVSAGPAAVQLPARRAPSRPGWTTSSRRACRSTPKPAADCWAATDFIVLTSRGGGYGPGTPEKDGITTRPGCRTLVSLTGLQPRFITAELTMADVNPAMADLRPLAADSLSRSWPRSTSLWTAERRHSHSSQQPKPHPLMVEARHGMPEPVDQSVPPQRCGGGVRSNR
mgnify:CR=1 FL=1